MMLHRIERVRVKVVTHQRHHWHRMMMAFMFARFSGVQYQVACLDQIVDEEQVESNKIVHI